MPNQLTYKNESYFIIGLCMDVHNELGKGFNEKVYGDALEIKLSNNGVPFEREVEYKINYKGKTLRHRYYADFVIEDKIIIELKAIQRLTDNHIKQVLNYLAASKLKLGLLVNFGEDSLIYKRVIL